MVLLDFQTRLIFFVNEFNEFGETTEVKATKISGFKMSNFFTRRHNDAKISLCSKNDPARSLQSHPTHSINLLNSLTDISEVTFKREVQPIMIRIIDL